MGRRRNGLDDLVDLASSLPWWVSLILAVVSWLVLSALAGAEVAASTSNPSATLAAALPRAIASVAQYILPAAFVLGALTSLGRRLRNGYLLRRVARTSGPDADPLLTMNWQNFEHLVGELFRRRGFKVVETPPGADGGVDLVLRRDGQTHLVQCKHWRSRDVGVSVVRELYGIVSARQAAGGAVVTGGRFTAEAAKFAKQCAIELVNGEELRRIAWLTDRGAELTPNAPDRQAGTAAVPACPRCGSGMVERTAKKGPNAGNRFWGCSRYPNCRGIRALPESD